MGFFVCDAKDLEKHGELLLKSEQAARKDCFQAALNNYEEEGLTLLHVVPEYDRSYGPDGKYLPLFIFKTPDKNGE